MIRWMLFLFIGLTLVATTMTYSNAGMEDISYQEPPPPSVRSGSRSFSYPSSSSSSSSRRSSGYSSGYRSGGYRGGK